MKIPIFFWVLILSFCISSTVLGADEKSIYRSILKVRTYEYNSTNDTYSIAQEWSAVAIGNGLLLTNAHVVFNAAQGVPDGYYEICRTIDFRKKAVCFTTGEILAYDEANDLALLRFAQPNDLPAAPLFQENIINIGAYVVAYGYPGIGGENISRTQWNVAGYEEPFYKIDGAIDHGNSGGGAFNKYGQLLGIPSRVSSDNAVIGYMIPITTIREFIAKKSKWYTSISLKAPADFKKFIRESELGERSHDIINDTNIKTASLKKYWLTFLGKVEGIGTFLYGMNLSNLGESALYTACYKFGWTNTLENIDERTSGDILKKYKIITTTAWKDGQYLIKTLQSLVSSGNGDIINIYDTKNTCASTISKINITKNKKIIDQALAFVTSGITLKKSYKQMTGFDTQLFRIDKLPAWVSVKESASEWGESTIEVGYFGTITNTGESLSEMMQKEKDTLDGYFLGGKSYFDDSPSDANLKPSEYSFETFRKLYEKKYSEKWFSNTNVTIESSKNNKKYIIGTTDYKSETSKDNVITSVIVFSYPYMTTKWDKKEYHELTYINAYKWGNREAIAALKEFFKNIELIGNAPF
jgi:hypothetical protein